MLIAVVNELSAVARNGDLIDALRPLGHTVINAGMKSPDDPPLNYIHIGFLGGLLLNAGRAEYVVGGCGTGQGFFNAVLQYPNVSCGLIAEPLDAWLFARVNAGNCASFRMNQAYGWGAPVNLRLMAENLFADTSELGYPPERMEAQREGRAMLAELSAYCHRTMAEIVRGMDARVVDPVLSFPGVWELLDVRTLADQDLASILATRHSNPGPHATHA